MLDWIIWCFCISDMTERIGRWEKERKGRLSLCYQSMCLKAWAGFSWSKKNALSERRVCKPICTYVNGSCIFMTSFYAGLNFSKSDMYVVAAEFLFRFFKSFFSIFYLVIEAGNNSLNKQWQVLASFFFFIRWTILEMRYKKNYKNY